MAGVMKSNNVLPSQEPEDQDKALEAGALDKALVIHKDHQVLHGDMLGGHDDVVLDMVEFEEDPLLCSDEVVNMCSSANREKLLTGGSPQGISKKKKSKPQGEKSTRTNPMWSDRAMLK
ncbi:hypothetical protein KY289_001151 [Solanum tuberosum]|nr:hypothetical protein KY289_001151 [Solanum tuberosum]